jgi:hypothetical protein
VPRANSDEPAEDEEDEEDEEQEDEEQEEEEQEQEDEEEQEEEEGQADEGTAVEQGDVTADMNWANFAHSAEEMQGGFCLFDAAEIMIEAAAPSSSWHGRRSARGGSAVIIPRLCRL